MGCAGYVLWVAQAMCRTAQVMWSRLRRLCAGLIENKAKLSPAKLGLRLSLAKVEESWGTLRRVMGSHWGTRVVEEMQILLSVSEGVHESVILWGIEELKLLKRAQS